MKQAVMKKWVRALRSGKFRRGKSALKRERKGHRYHCCLGVLCEVYQKETGRHIDAGQGWRGVFSFGGETSILPEVVRRWANLKTPLGSVVIDSRQTSLAELNDMTSKFEDIANIIKKHWRAL